MGRLFLGIFLGLNACNLGAMEQNSAEAQCIEESMPRVRRAVLPKVARAYLSDPQGARAIFVRTCELVAEDGNDPAAVLAHSEVYPAWCEWRAREEGHADVSAALQAGHQVRDN